MNILLFIFEKCEYVHAQVSIIVFHFKNRVITRQYKTSSFISFILKQDILKYYLSIYLVGKDKKKISFHFSHKQICEQLVFNSKKMFKLYEDLNSVYFLSKDLSRLLSMYV
ncbi:hypothetical protein TTHERM_001049259 (macronuclear) [Tetrahymena thermophila SB210]|uniref:Uncharacterized protein n=1 Tax=Tetrahymena thermophila (strain SB210) TaxID=312017 RepID=W7X1Q8_TETTS|nr:hypothetical protein TTHERM_001049259 [Tetrahymena thermophila SB210]EWS71557.1 hypothetical protein TTHERM_001049259 [Tetrahymena thermophila SB210]|eukprot:XP_012655902.1 hypothetical protein TTHERM_001049259 [Tetrahymena thermophila SB210]